MRARRPRVACLHGSLRNLRGAVPLLIIALGISGGFAQARAQQVPASPSVSSTVTPPPRGVRPVSSRVRQTAASSMTGRRMTTSRVVVFKTRAGRGAMPAPIVKRLEASTRISSSTRSLGAFPCRRRGLAPTRRRRVGGRSNCPSSAPYQWRTIEAQGQTYQFWTDTSGWMKNLAPVPDQNSSGPNPPAKADWSMHNWSAIHSHHWGYIVGCSTISDGSSAVYSQPPYSHGQGTSACPDNWPIPACASHGIVVGGPRTRMLKGPAYRVTRTGSRSYGVTREVDLHSGRIATYSLSCRRGYRRVSQHWAVGWYTTTPPSRRQGQTQERVISERARSLTLSVRTNAHVRPGTARLQIALDCRR